MENKLSQKYLSILEVLKNNDELINSPQIYKELLISGFDIKERTIRQYLQNMGEKGLTEKIGKQGYRITSRGIQEFEATKVTEKIGLLSAKIDQIIFQMNFDLNTKKGTVIINTAIIEIKHFLNHLNEFKKVFELGYAMGNLLILFKPGETINGLYITENMIGIGTVCSITLNGVLLKHGVPVVSRFGGLLEFHNYKPIGFTDIIMYDGTSVDPLTVFMKSKMTDYLGAIKTGSGRIGASFRVFPSVSRKLVKSLVGKLQDIGLGGFLAIGNPNKPLFQIPVSEGRVGAVLIGGLNPIAVFEESNIRVQSQALAGLIEYNKLFHYKELDNRLDSIIKNLKIKS